VRRAGGEIERLRQMEHDLRDQLRKILESVIEGDEPQEQEQAPAPPPPAQPTASDELTLPPSWTSTSD